MEEILTAEIAKIAKREMRNWLLCDLCGSSHLVASGGRSEVRQRFFDWDYQVNDSPVG
jgi:hypothetical protein